MTDPMIEPASPAGPADRSRGSDWSHSDVPIVVALVPAKDRADSVGATVTSLLGLAGVDRVVVIDDGSTDDTSARASAAGAEVLRLARNQGKSAAIRAGVDHTPEAGIYLLIDADLASTAQVAEELLEPVIADRADLAIGVLPPAAGRGGFGLIKGLSARGVVAGGGPDLQAPLSGQRAIKADLLRSMGHVERFGLEVAMSIDVARAGGRICEVPVPMDHRHTGRSLSGFLHRGRQGLDIASALSPRLISGRWRAIAAVGLVIAFTVASTFTAGSAVPSSAPPTVTFEKVVLIGAADLGLGDIAPATMPNLDRIASSGALGVASPRTGGGRNAANAYATIGAGAPVVARGSHTPAAHITTELEDGTVQEVADRRRGSAVPGPLIVTSLAAVTPTSKTSTPRSGAVADALHSVGAKTAVVANSATTIVGATEAASEGDLDVPAAMAVADQTGSIDHGNVSSELLVEDPAKPFGVSVDEERFMAEVTAAIESADLVVVDPGELDRTRAYRGEMSRSAAAQARLDALAATDRIIGQVAAGIPDGTLVIVTGLTPPSGGKLVPIVIAAEGLPGGKVTSPTTRRPSLVTLADVGPTILESLGIEVPASMAGRAIRYSEGIAQRGDMELEEALIRGRDRVYGSLIDTFTRAIVLLYVAASVAVRRARTATVGGAIRFAMLVTAAWPVSTFLLRALPSIHGRGTTSHLLVWLLAGAIAAVASLPGRKPTTPLVRIAQLTFLVLTVDVVFGAHLQVSSYLGYTPTVAARFVGVGNAASGIYMAAAVLTAVSAAARPTARGAFPWAAAAVLGVAAVLEGAPWLGSDVGGLLTLVPVTCIVLALLTSVRFRGRHILWFGGATALVLAMAVGAEALRPADSRTHIGRFFLDGDISSTIDTFTRKIEVNLRLITSSDWRWQIFAIGAFAIVILGAQFRRRVVLDGTLDRAAVIGLLATAGIGWVTNDSGTVLAALVLCTLGPLLFICFDSRSVAADRPELIAPLPGGSDR